MMFRPILALSAALAAIPGAASAALSPDVSATTVRQVVLGIGTPAEWTNIPHENIGSLVLTTRTSDAASGSAVLTRRLDASLTMNSDRILDDALPATEVTIHVVRASVVIARCVLDLGHSLGSPEQQVNDYRLLLTERGEGSLQAASGTCVNIDAGGGESPGIPALVETDGVRLDTTGLRLQSLAAVQ